jgi:hypothetical protein
MASRCRLLRMTRLGDPGVHLAALEHATDVPVTLTTKGKGVEMSFDGKTKEGVGLRVNAKCSEVENLP